MKFREITADELGLTDEETTVFTIGKRPYRIAPLRLTTVKRAFGPLEHFMQMDRTDPNIMFEAVGAIMSTIALGIIQTRADAIFYAEETGGETAAAALDKELPPIPAPRPANGDTPAKSSAEVLSEFLNERIFPGEVEAIHDQVFMLIRRSGMTLGEKAVAAAGAVAAGAEESPSTETSTA